MATSQQKLLEEKNFHRFSPKETSIQMRRDTIMEAEKLPADWSIFEGGGPARRSGSQSLNIFGGDSGSWSGTDMWVTVSRIITIKFHCVIS